MGMMTALGKDDFYAPLAIADRTYLQDAATYINTRRALIYDLIIEVGLKLLEVKEQFFSARRYPTFESWCSMEFEESQATLINYMNVARRMGNLDIHQREQLTLTALYLLSKRTVTDESRALALQLADNGIRVGDDSAWVLANAPDYIRVATVEQELTPRQAYALSHRLKEADPMTRDFCYLYDVKDIELVDALSGDGGATAITRIMEDGGVLNGIAWSKPVGQARLADYERWREDQNRIRRAEHLPDMVIIECTGRLDVTLTGTPIVVLNHEDAPQFQRLLGRQAKVTLRVRVE